MSKNVTIEELQNKLQLIADLMLIYTDNQRELVLIYQRFKQEINLHYNHSDEIAEALAMAKTKKEMA